MLSHYRGIDNLPDAYPVKSNSRTGFNQKSKIHKSDAVRQIRVVIICGGITSREELSTRRQCPCSAIYMQTDYESPGAENPAELASWETSAKALHAEGYYPFLYRQRSTQ